MSETNGHTMTDTGLTPAQLQTFSALLNRAALSSRLGVTFGGARNLHEVLGYKARLAYADYKARFYREGLARRIVQAYPKAMWAQPPTLDEVDSQEVVTPFEADWQGLAQRLNLYSILRRADIQANLGQYSVLFLGLRGQGQALDTPAQPVSGGLDDLLYIEPYSEEWVTVSRLETNADLPTFGQVAEYTINFHRNRERAVVGSVPVHASRVVHLVGEDTLDDLLYGISILEGIYDRLDDLIKVLGGSAEMFWRDAKRRLALNLQKDAQVPNPEAITDEIEEFMHGMRDFIRTQGMDVQSLAGTVASPQHHIDAIMENICAAVRIPKRRLLGSERGELASSQDEEMWLQAVGERQQNYGQPMLRLLADRLIALRVLRAPLSSKGYLVNWGNLQSLSELQQAEVAQRVGNALNAYAPGAAEAVVPLPEFREVYLGLTPYSEYGVIDLLPQDEMGPAGGADALGAPGSAGDAATTGGS